LNDRGGRIAAAATCISRGFLAVAGVMILMMAFCATYGVTRRYLLHDPEPYSYEISMMLLLWCFVLSVAAVQDEDRHLRGDFILNRLPVRYRFFVRRILSPALAVLCGGALAWKGWDAAMFSRVIGERSNSAWAEPLFPVKVVIPIGYGALLLVSLIQLFIGIYQSVQKKGNEG
jgi:TRAP-type C4-dicarboxylate transport system permease small subunit